ncbi:MAG: type II toxin-antitoxin system Phd/YefM family antitoxin [Candidatus Omnitrophica bacterium]|nr:type II toxin-antitoxin system Phd/YefM family antitoxin [Candidatus Omnitrophota bacterium]
MTKNIKLKELRPNLTKIIEEVDSKMTRFIVTKRGKPTAVIMAIEDYESLLETLEILSNAGLGEKIKAAEEDVRKGNIQSLDEIYKKQ